MTIEQTEEYKKLCEVYGVEEDTSQLAYFTGSMGFPLFTHKKQLELIKLIAKHSFFVGEIEKDMWCINLDFKPFCDKSFELCLIQTLIKCEKFIDHQKVKEILEG